MNVRPVGVTAITYITAWPDKEGIAKIISRLTKGRPTLSVISTKKWRQPDQAGAMDRKKIRD